MDVKQIIYTGFDICAVILNAIIIVNYFICKRLNTRSSVFYKWLTICALISGVFNLLSIVVVRVVISAPLYLAYMLTLFNYIGYIAAGIMFLIYMLYVLYENSPMPKSATAVVVALAAVGVVALVLDSLSWVIPSMHTAVFGNVCGALVYICEIAAFIAALVYSAINNKRLNTVQQFNTYFFICLNVAAALVQYLIPDLQIANFALAVCVLLVYISLKRPEDVIDPVSGAFNNTAFLKRASQMLKVKTDFLISVTEVKNMSVVNSYYGIRGGNEVICQIEKRIRNFLGKNYVVYRLDGSKFAVIFNSEETCFSFKSDFEKLYDKPFTVDGLPIQLTGLTCIIRYPEVTDKLTDIDEVLNYYISDTVNNSGVIEAERDSVEKNHRRALVNAAIENALKNKSFDVYYQPIYSLKDKKFNYCEALIRLKDEELGFISPDEFIPLAEQNGQIVGIGKMVIEEVCRFLKEHSPEKYGLDSVDINLSVIQCMHPEIISNIDKTLKKYAIPKSRINLEVSETSSTKSPMLKTRLNELHSLGYEIALDDFGTGLSSVEYLIDFNFDVVKLDKSLIWAYMSTKKYEPILNHYMPMLHSLGIRIVAEGVETEDMVKSLEKIGCDYLQGYYFSKPLPKDDFVKFLSRNAEVQVIK